MCYMHTTGSCQLVNDYIASAMYCQVKRQISPGSDENVWHKPPRHLAGLYRQFIFQIKRVPC